MSWKLKAGAIILVAYLLLAGVSPFLVDPNDVENWHYATYWDGNPKFAPPAWVNLFGKNLPPTGDVPGDGRTYRYYFLYSLPPRDILIVPPSNWSGEVSVWVRTPDGRNLLLYSGLVSGPTSIGRSSYTMLQVAREVGVSEGTAMNLIVSGDSLKLVFGRWENGEWVPIHGVYTFTVNSSAKVKLRLVGRVYGLLGTDSYGRDLSVVFFGGLPETLAIVFATALMTAFLGTITGLFGALSGKVGRLVEGFGKISSMLPLVPAMILLVPILDGVSYYGTLEVSLWPVVLALSLLLFGKVSQNVRTLTITELSKEHIRASKALGANDAWVLRRHVLKAVLPYVSSQFVLTSAKVIALISILGFFGVSFDFNWGELFTIVVTQRAIYNGAWWMILPVGVAITLLAVGLLLIKSEIEEKFINPWENL